MIIFSFFLVNMTKARLLLRLRCSHFDYYCYYLFILKKKVAKNTQLNAIIVRSSKFIFGFNSSSNICWDSVYIRVARKDGNDISIVLLSITLLNIYHYIVILH